MTTPRIFKMSFARVYPLYIQKAEKKGRTAAEVNEIITWLRCAHLAGPVGGKRGLRHLYDQCSLL